MFALRNRNPIPSFLRAFANATPRRNLFSWNGFPGERSLVQQEPLPEKQTKLRGRGREKADSEKAICMQYNPILSTTPSLTLNLHDIKFDLR